MSIEFRIKQNGEKHCYSNWTMNLKSFLTALYSNENPYEALMSLDRNTQPTFFILRRIKMYEVKHELKYGNYSVSEKFGLAIQSSIVKPSIDKDFIIYTVVILTMIAMFFPYNGLMIIFENQLLGIPLVLLIVPGMATLISIVNKIKG